MSKDGNHRTFMRDEREKICPDCHMDVSVHERYGMCPVVVVEQPAKPQNRRSGETQP